MEGHTITISESGTVTITGPVRMTFPEIAGLFGVFVQTVRSNVKAILKSGVVTADMTDGGILDGNLILPDYYGLDMVSALSFRINSRKAGLFREWILKRAATQEEKKVCFQVFVAAGDKSDRCFLN